MTRAVALFLVLAFGISWTVSEVYYRAIGSTPLGDAIMAIVFMWGPGIAAVFTTRFVLKQKIGSLGPLFRANRWLVFAMLIPIGVIASYTLVAALHPETGMNLTNPRMLAAILAALPQHQHAEVQAALSLVADHLVLVQFLQVLLGGTITGLTVTSIAALGEELGWRGFLHRSWQSMGFWKRSSLIGLIWGAWHAPMILRGHNDVGAPWLGVAMMIVFCVLWSPLFEFVRERSGNLWPAVVMHGVLNAVAGGAMLFTSGGPGWWRSPIGLSTSLVLAGACVMVAILRRRVAPA